MTDLELLTVGRISVDLYAEQRHVPLREVTSFRKSVGGTATNVAVACARLGHRSAVFTKVGADAMGDYIRWALEETFGVDTRFMGRHPDLPTPLAFAELADPGDPTIIFYRQPAAPDSTITLDEVDLDVVRAVPILWVPGGCFAFEPSRTTAQTLLAERARRTHTVLDLDWRPALWRDPSAAPGEMAQALANATVAIGNRTECEIAVGSADPDEAADRLLETGLSAAIVKMGADGVLVATRDGVRERIAPYPVDVVCGLGAGDAFGGAICHALLAGWDLVRGARAANVAGAIVASRLMCADDMPGLHEIEAILDAPSGPATTPETR